MKLALLLPCGSDIPVLTVMSLLALENYVIRNPIQGEEIELNIFIEQSSLLISSRENLVKRAIAWEADWILWIDSDMTFPPETFHQLQSHGKPMAGANYVKRSVPTTPVTTGLNDKFVKTDPDTEGLEEVKHTGFGVLLMHIGVFKKVEQPWFDTVWIEKKDEPGKLELMGEDVFMFGKIRHHLNLKPWIDHDLSQAVTHIGEFEYHNRLAKAAIEEVDSEEVKEKLYG